MLATLIVVEEHHDAHGGGVRCATRLTRIKILKTRLNQVLMDDASKQGLEERL